MSKNFSLRELGNQAVGVYVNDVGLIEGQDYIYETGFESFVKITKKLVAGDKIKIYEYNSTEGFIFHPFTKTRFISNLFQVSLLIIHTLHLLMLSKDTTEVYLKHMVITEMI